MSIFLQKVRAAAAALPSRVVLLGLLTTFSQAVRAESPAPSPAVNCELMSRGPDVLLLQQEATLHTLLNDFLGALRSGRYDDLSQYFNPAAKVGSSIGDKVKALLDNRYDAPLQFSVFRVWRLRSPSISKDIISNCPESEGALIISQFGREKQFAIWLQVMGQNELGRMILAVSPDKGRMLITGFRMQQWTQQGSDWEAWTKQAQEHLSKGDKIQAYFAFDVAQKLLSGEDFVIYPKQKEIKEARDSLFSQGDLVKQLNDHIKGQSIAYLGSLLTKEGTGILLREIVTPTDTTQALQVLCRKRARSLQEIGWLKDKQGIRCNFIVAGMDPTQDSPLGGFYLNANDLKNPQK